MDFTRTAREAATALIGAAMLGMTAFSAATEESVKAREAATALIIALFLVGWALRGDVERAIRQREREQRRRQNGRRQ